MRRPLALRYLPLDEVVTEPGNGHWEVWAKCWWAYQPGKGLILYGNNPQCNRNESIARSIQKSLYPDAEVIFMPTVCLPHNCNDYL